MVFVCTEDKVLENKCFWVMSLHEGLTPAFLLQVVECQLVTDPRSKESRGFGFVTMESVEDADRCIKNLNRSVFEGRLITVEKVWLLRIHIHYHTVKAKIFYLICKVLFLQNCT